MLLFILMREVKRNLGVYVAAVAAGCMGQLGSTAFAANRIVYRL
jgi:hypothetical protein